jgi:hypothetical protein
MPYCRCGNEFSEARSRLGFDYCLDCGKEEAAAEIARRARMIVPISHKSGYTYLGSFGDNDEELPNDIDDEKYISIPDKRELDLGKPLVLDFACELLPVDYDEVRHIFSRSGAYRRYKDLLVRRGALKRWYDFSTRPRKRF